MLALSPGTRLRSREHFPIDDTRAGLVAEIVTGARAGWFVAIVADWPHAPGEDLDTWIESPPEVTEAAAFRHLALFLAAWAGW